jgi:hypothetical protein
MMLPHTQLRQFQFRERERLQYALVEDNAPTLPLLAEESKTHRTPVDRGIVLVHAVIFAISENKSDHDHLVPLFIHRIARSTELGRRRARRID